MVRVSFFSEKFSKNRNKNGSGSVYIHSSFFNRFGAEFLLSDPHKNTIAAIAF